jgi:exosortase A
MKHGTGAIVANDVRRGDLKSPPAMSIAVGQSERRLVPQGLAVLALIAGVAVVVGIVYAETFLSMFRLWRSMQHGHGVLVVPIAAFLLWRMRESLAQVPLEATLWGVVPLCALVLLWFVGATVGIQLVEQLAAVLLIPATVVTFLGWPLVRRAMFPLFFLVAAVPIGDGLIPHLMRTTARLATALLTLFGIPVFRQGQFLTLPGGEFEIADVCAGMQYLTAGTIIGVLVAYLTFHSSRKRVICVLAFGVAMVITNAVRAFVVMYVASATQMRYLVGADHVYFGWVLFSAVIAALIYAANRFADAEPEPVPAAAAGAAPESPYAAGPATIVALSLLVAIVMTAMPAPMTAARLLLWPAAGALAWAAAQLLRGKDLRGPPVRHGSALAGAALCLSGAALAAGPMMLAKRLETAALDPPALAVPVVAGCSAPGAWAAGPHPEFESPDRTVAATYDCAGSPTNIFIAAYADNVQGRELVSDANRLAPAGWRRVTTAEAQAVSLTDGRSLTVNELQLDSAGSRWLVWYWYAVGGKRATSGAVVKLRQAVQLVLEGRADGSVYIVQTPLDGSVESSRGRLVRVAEQVVRP